MSQQDGDPAFPFDKGDQGHHIPAHANPNYFDNYFATFATQPHPQDFQPQQQHQVNNYGHQEMQDNRQAYDMSGLKQALAPDNWNQTHNPEYDADQQQWGGDPAPQYMMNQQQEYYIHEHPNQQQHQEQLFQTYDEDDIEDNYQYQGQNQQQRRGSGRIQDSTNFSQQIYEMQGQDQRRMSLQAQKPQSIQVPDSAYTFTVTVIPCGNEDSTANSMGEMPYELTLKRNFGDQHNLKEICMKYEVVWKRVYSQLQSSDDSCPNFAVYRTPFDVNVAMAGMTDQPPVQEFKPTNTTTLNANLNSAAMQMEEAEGDGSRADLLLHILYMKTTEKKLTRNYNAQELELFCHNRFYGPLIVAHNLNKAPFPLVSFTLADLQNIETINRNIQNKSIKDDFVPSCLLEFQLLNQNLANLLTNEDRYAFFMFNYKTSWCPTKKDSHDSKSCVYAHHMRDFRRPPMLFRYAAEDCDVLQHSHGWDTCPKGLKCGKCHTMVERLYHPEKYKRIACDKQRCNKLEICAFYHTMKERNQALKLSKTFKKTSATAKKMSVINDLHNELTRFYANEKAKTLESMKSVQSPEDGTNDAPKADKTTEQNKQQQVQRAAIQQTKSIQSQQQQQQVPHNSMHMVHQQQVPHHSVHMIRQQMQQQQQQPQQNYQNFTGAVMQHSMSNPGLLNTNNSFYPTTGLQSNPYQPQQRNSVVTPPMMNHFGGQQQPGHRQDSLSSNGSGGGNSNSGGSYHSRGSSGNNFQFGKFAQQHVQHPSQMQYPMGGPVQFRGPGTVQNPGFQPVKKKKPARRRKNSSGSGSSGSNGEDQSYQFKGPNQGEDAMYNPGARSNQEFSHNTSPVAFVPTVDLVRSSDGPDNGIQDQTANFLSAATPSALNSQSTTATPKQADKKELDPQAPTYSCQSACFTQDFDYSLALRHQESEWNVEQTLQKGFGNSIFYQAAESETSRSPPRRLEVTQNFHKQESQTSEGLEEIGNKFDFLHEDEDLFSIAEHANRVKTKSDYLRRLTMVNDEKKSRRSSSNSKKVRGRQRHTLSRISELASPVTLPESSPTAVVKGVLFADQEDEFEMVQQDDDFDALMNTATKIREKTFHQDARKNKRPKQEEKASLPLLGKYSQEIVPQRQEEQEQDQKQI